MVVVAVMKAHALGKHRVDRLAFVDPVAASDGDVDA